MSPTTTAPAPTVVPVSHPAHPSHFDWLRIIRTALEAAITIGPAVVTIVDPKDAALAQKLGTLAAGVMAATSGEAPPAVD